MIRYDRPDPLTALDLAILFTVVAHGIRAGFASRREASRGLEKCFVAGRSLKCWHAGSSLAATQFAAVTPLPVMGLIAVGGVASLRRLWIHGLAFLFMGFVLGTAWRHALAEAFAWPSRQVRFLQSPHWQRV